MIVKIVVMNWLSLTRDKKVKDKNCVNVVGQVNNSGYNTIFNTTLLVFLLSCYTMESVTVNNRRLSQKSVVILKVQQPWKAYKLNNFKKSTVAA